MAPGKAHEDAIQIIKSTLKDEFRIDDCHFYESYSVYKKRPDIVFRNPVTNRMIVVEVGNTSAEKIAIYLSVPKIEEIRWYTRYCKKKGVHLCGQWFTDDVSKTFITQKSCRIRERERRIKSDIKEYERRLQELKISPDSYICCSGCGQHLLLKQASFVTHHKRQYCVCPDCMDQRKFETMSSQREALYEFITAKSLWIKEQCKRDGLNSERPQNTPL